MACEFLYIPMQLVLDSTTNISLNLIIADLCMKLMQLREREKERISWKPYMDNMKGQNVKV